MLTVDNTILAATAACSTKAAMRYVLGLVPIEQETDSGPMIAGQAAHAALDGFLRTGDADKALEEFDAVYVPYLAAREAAGNPIPDNDRLAPANVKACLEEWMQTHQTLPYTVDPQRVEVGFSVPLALEVTFVGRMDGLVQTQGAWYVLEHKTTGRMDTRWRARFRSSAQITGYVWAATVQEKLPVVGCYVNGIEFAKLPSDDKRKCRTHGVAYAECGMHHARSDLVVELRSPAQLEQWQQTAVQMAQRFLRLREVVKGPEDVRTLPMEGTLTGECVWCPFQTWCMLGRPAEAAKVMFREERWEPYKHAFQEEVEG